MWQALLSVASLILGVTLMQIGNGQFGTFLSVRMQAEGFSSLTIGIVGSAYFAGFILGTVYCDRLVERAGHIRAFAALASLMSAVALLHALIIAPWTWTLMRLVTGCCIAGLFVITESWINERATNEMRGQIFAIYMIASYLALGGGQFLLGFGETAGLQQFLFASLLFSLSLVPIALTRAASPAPVERAPFNFLRLYRISPLGVIGCLACGLINGAFYPLGPVFARGVGLDVEFVSYFMGITILSGLLLQLPIGRLSDRLDRRSIMVAVLAAVAAISLLIVLAARGDPVALLAFGALYGGFVFTIYPLAVAHVNDHIEPHELVPVSAGLILIYGIGAAAGPLIASMVIDAAGPQGLFLFTGGMAAVVALFGLYRMTRRQAVPVDEQGPFVTMNRTTAVIGALDPRAEPEEQYEMTFEGDPENDAVAEAADPVSPQSRI